MKVVNPQWIPPIMNCPSNSATAEETGNESRDSVIQNQEVPHSDSDDPSTMYSTIPTKYVMDAGYYSEENLKALSDYDVYMPDTHLSYDRKELCVRPDQLPDLETKTYQRRSTNTNWKPQGKYTQAMREKWSSDSGKETYGKRIWVVEGVFSILTDLRNGYSFMRKGLERVQEEWAEWSIAYNLGKLIGFHL